MLESVLEKRRLRRGIRTRDPRNHGHEYLEHDDRQHVDSTCDRTLPSDSLIVDWKVIVCAEQDTLEEEHRR